MKKTIEERELQFIALCAPFVVKYGEKLLKEFVDYWTEIGINDRKMRFEKENTFGLSRRLARFKLNHDKWNKSSTKKVNAGDILKAKYGLN